MAPPFNNNRVMAEAPLPMIPPLYCKRGTVDSVGRKSFKSWLKPREQRTKPTSSKLHLYVEEKILQFDHADCALSSEHVFATPKVNRFPPPRTKNPPPFPVLLAPPDHKESTERIGAVPPRLSIRPRNQRTKLMVNGDNFEVSNEESSFDMNAYATPKMLTMLTTFQSSWWEDSTVSSTHAIRIHIDMDHLSSLVERPYRSQKIRKADNN